MGAEEPQHWVLRSRNTGCWGAADDPNWGNMDNCNRITISCAPGIISSMSLTYRFKFPWLLVTRWSILLFSAINTARGAALVSRPLCRQSTYLLTGSCHLCHGMFLWRSSYCQRCTSLCDLAGTGKGALPSQYFRNKIIWVPLESFAIPWRWNFPLRSVRTICS